MNGIISYAPSGNHPFKPFLKRWCPKMYLVSARCLDRGTGLPATRLGQVLCALPAAGHTVLQPWWADWALRPSMLLQKMNRVSSDAIPGRLEWIFLKDKKKATPNSATRTQGALSQKESRSLQFQRTWEDSRCSDSLGDLG